MTELQFRIRRRPQQPPAEWEAGDPGLDAARPTRVDFARKRAAPDHGISNLAVTVRYFLTSDVDPHRAQHRDLTVRQAEARGRVRQERPLDELEFEPVLALVSGTESIVGPIIRCTLPRPGLYRQHAHPMDRTKLGQFLRTIVV